MLCRWAIEEYFWEISAHKISTLCPLQVLDLAAVFSVETCTVALPLSYRGILCGNDLSSRQVTLQVLSARQSLTSVFGMRTGGPLRYHHHNGYIICILIAGYIRLFSVEHWQLHRSVYHNLFLFRTFGFFCLSIFFLSTLFRIVFVYSFFRISIRPISIGQLNASQRLHTRPINPVVFRGS